jgi:hypothetical protein
VSVIISPSEIFRRLNAQSTIFYAPKIVHAILHGKRGLAQRNNEAGRSHSRVPAVQRTDYLVRPPSVGGESRGRASGHPRKEDGRTRSFNYEGHRGTIRGPKTAQSRTPLQGGLTQRPNRHLSHNAPVGAGGRRMVVERRPRQKRSTRKEEKKEGAPAAPPTRPTCACKTDAAPAIRLGRAPPRTAYVRGDADHQRGGQDIVRRYSRDGASEGPARGDRRRFPRN